MCWAKSPRRHEDYQTADESIIDLVAEDQHFKSPWFFHEPMRIRWIDLAIAIIGIKDFATNGLDAIAMGEDSYSEVDHF